MTKTLKMTASLLTGLALLAAVAVAPALVGSANAADATNFYDDYTSSVPSAASDHELNFTLSDAVSDDGSTITIDFDTDGFDASSITAADIDVSGDTAGDMVVAGVCGTPGDQVGAAVASNVITLTFCNGEGGSLLSGEVVTVEIGTNADGGANQIVNPTLPVDTNGEINLGGTAGITGTTYIAIVDEVTVTAEIAETFTFVVTGVDTTVAAGNGLDAAGVCASGTNNDVETTNTTIPWGTLVAGTAKCASHDLAVTTNASNGFTVSVFESAPLANANNDQIGPFADGVIGGAATWAAPTNTLGSPLEYAHWGVTSDDTSLSGGDDFGTALLVGISQDGSAPTEIFWHDGPADGLVAGSGSATATYMIEIGSNAAAGNYTGTIQYLAYAAY